MSTRPTREFMVNSIYSLEWLFNPQDFPEYFRVKSGDRQNSFAEWSFKGVRNITYTASYEDLHDLWVLLIILVGFIETTLSSAANKRVSLPKQVYYSGGSVYLTDFAATYPSRYTACLTRALAIANDYGNVPGSNTLP